MESISNCHDNVIAPSAYHYPVPCAEYWNLTSGFVSKVYLKLYDTIGYVTPISTAKLFKPVQDSAEELLRISGKCAEPRLDNDIAGVHVSSLIRRGKGLRPIILRQVYNNMVASGSISHNKQAEEAVLLMGVILEGMHNLTLIIDDCIDGDLYRRGQESVSSQYGVRAVVTLSRHVIRSLESIINELPLPIHKKEAVVDLVNRVAISVAGAIADEIKWQDAPHEIEWNRMSREEIIRTYINKTSIVMGLGIDLLAMTFDVNGKAVEQFQELTYEMGIILQRVNDIENYSLDKDGMHNKDRFGDIRERRVTLLVMRPEIDKSYELRRLRESAFRSDSSEKDVCRFGEAIIQSGILHREALEIINKATSIRTRYLLKNNITSETREIFDYVISSYLKPIQ